MPDGLYERDVLAWSQYQADLLRRLGSGEEVNGVDWTNVAEEIESVGRSELHSLEEYLQRAVIHLLKLYAWPDDPNHRQWRCEIVGFQAEARRRFCPSTRQRVDVAALVATAAEVVSTVDPSARVLSANPFTLDHLLQDDIPTLLNRLPPP
jgi:hypothetical protein